MPRPAVAPPAAPHDLPLVVARPSAPPGSGALAGAVARLRRLGRVLAGKQRRHPRGAVAARAALHASGTVQVVQVRDISVGGVGFDAAMRPRVGAEIRVELLDLPERPILAAVVRHVTGPRVGAEWIAGGDTARDAAERLVGLFPDAPRAGPSARAAAS